MQLTDDSFIIQDWWDLKKQSDKLTPGTDFVAISVVYEKLYVWHKKGHFD